MAKEPSELSLLTRRQLAEVFAKDVRTIAKWLEEGMPVAVIGRGGRPSRYSLPECVQWVIERELQARGAGEDVGVLSPQQERAKLDQKRREELDMKLQIRRGELVEVDTVRREFADIGTAVKARLRAIPDAVADLMAAASLKSPAAVKSLLLGKIDDALRELARAADVVIPVAEDEGPDEDDDEGNYILDSLDAVV